MRFFGMLALAFALAGFAGCEPKPVESGPKPTVALKETYDKAVAAAQKIRDAIEKGEIDSAHDELHDIGHYLEDLPAMAKAASMDAAKQESLEKATKSLFDVMLKIDESLHDAKEVKFEDVKDGLDGGLTELKGLGDSLPK
ncbi:hypothetical protein SH501x_001084 [Pirellulaceae bacterium SH501]